GEVARGTAVASEQRAGAARQVGVGLGGRAGTLVGLAFDPLYFEGPPEPIGDLLRVRNVETAIGLARAMRRKRWQILIEADGERTVGGITRRRHSAEKRGQASRRKPAHHGALRLET